MTDRPILFSTPMVLAIFNDQKTQTRRIASSPLRKVEQGDRLWVRETFSRSMSSFHDPIWYWANGNPPDGDYDRPQPSIHMPRWASRMTLIVEMVRMQPLQHITSADAIAEGIPAQANSSTIDCNTRDPRDDFRKLWDSLHDFDNAWNRNPDVVAISFRVERCNIDKLERDNG